ncbi:MAG: nucleotidyltransferase family protein [Ignavibacteriae bacterium]|nr:nucleotidyltransferase family protein [Ignavibacteriota bacterium]
MKPSAKKNGKKPLHTYKYYARIIKNHREELVKRYKIKEIGIFGSFVRGEQNRRSDVDVLVDYTKVPDLFEFINLELYLEKLLEKRVDLIDKEGIRPELKEIILGEVVYL